MSTSTEPQKKIPQMLHVPGSIKSYIADGHPTLFFLGNPYNRYINPYNKVDEFIPSLHLWELLLQPPNTGKQRDFRP